MQRISTNIPCFRESLAKVDPHLGNFSSWTNPVLPHTGVTKYIEVTPPPPGGRAVVTSVKENSVGYLNTTGDVMLQSRLKLGRHFLYLAPNWPYYDVICCYTVPCALLCHFDLSRVTSSDRHVTWSGAGCHGHVWCVSLTFCSVATSSQDAEFWLCFRHGIEIRGVKSFL